MYIGDMELMLLIPLGVGLFLTFTEPIKYCEGWGLTLPNGMVKVVTVPLSRVHTGTLSRTHTHTHTHMYTLHQVHEGNRTVSALMDTWTKQEGYPVVHMSFSGSKLTLSQRRFLAVPPDPYSDDG